MNKCDERTPAVRERDKRIRGLELRIEGLFARVSEEVARQATELGAEIAHQFAAARRGEMQELTERVAKLEQWQDEMDVLPAEDGEDNWATRTSFAIVPLERRLRALGLLQNEDPVDDVACATTTFAQLPDDRDPVSGAPYVAENYDAPVPLEHRIQALQAWRDTHPGEYPPKKDSEESDEEEDDMGGSGWLVKGCWPPDGSEDPRARDAGLPDGYEDPGPASISPQG